MTEKEIQKAVMNYLLECPIVAWVYVTSAGYVRGLKGGRAFKVGFNGLTDILGQLTDGRILAIEVKKPGEKPREDQLEFIENVNINNGLAFWVDDVKGVIHELEKYL